MFLKEFFILACFSAFNTAVKRASSHGKGFRCPTEELTACRGDTACGLLASQKAAKNLSRFSFLSWPLPSAEGIKPGSKSVVPKPSFGTHKDVSHGFEESPKFSKYFIFIYRLFQNKICPQTNVEKVSNSTQTF